MSATPAPPPRRLRRVLMMIVTVTGAIVALPFMLMLLVARIGGER